MSRLDFNATDYPPLESIAHLKARVDILDVVGRYASLKRRGTEYWAQCPLHADGTPSFKVNPGRQQFYCFGCGAKGDVLDFLEAAEGLTKGQAVERLRELAGGAAADPAAVAAQNARRAAAERQEAAEAAQRTAQARQIWSECVYLTRRDAPLAAAYLTERRGIRQWDSYALRFHPRCPWERGTAPCIVAPVENAEGELTGIWRIRLAKEGKVERLGLGPTKGNFAPVVDHAGLDTLTIAEGVEDALAAWELTTYPAWAALNAGNMAVLRLPTQFRHVIICADRDPGGQGLQGARTLALRLRAEGREARIIIPSEDKDPNDLLLRARAA